MACLLRVLSRRSRLTVSAIKLTPLSTRSFARSPSTILFSEEVREAKIENKPIVALESTIITHGMPYPVNLETGMQVEDIIRKGGAVPATIAILKGQLTVGLTKDQLQYLAEAKGVIKTSRRDFAPVMAGKLDGATTVAGTIIAAELADIPVFVTGGLGGVHREGETTLDVSADLNELGRSKTLVVCSGVKSILDIGRTLEYLETQGVCVCTFGETDDFPAFYTSKSGFKAPYRVSDAQQAAKILYVAHAYQLASGIVVAVPIPKEYALDETVIETAIKNALKEAKHKGIHGKEVTPFVLSAVSNATGGSSLTANIALVKNNAKVGADIAVEFKKLKNVDSLGNAFNIGFGREAGKSSPATYRHFHSSSNLWMEEGKLGRKEPIFSATDSDRDVLVIGGANVDRTYRVSEDRVQLDGSTHACLADQCAGGVARNMAEALWRLRDGRVKLITAIGDDADGEFLTNIAPGLILEGCVMNTGRTPTYAAVLDSRGDCLLGLGDMKMHNLITPELVDRHMQLLERAPLVVLDGNLPVPTINHIMELCHGLQKPGNEIDRQV
ncbi:hypothetical protein K1T71_003289 [Dendrolimus kikuchii]|uniref:Uncharacterized protein n=1 Tax=Dendrolimus kikuchii TaxID=765133 RepID=A0ACC1DB61_9NEOP|nr:hypothetical protein K1T71_003289 [Dendrolimus kikuchii]